MQKKVTFDGMNPLAWVLFTLMFILLAGVSALTAVVTGVVWFVVQPLKWVGVIGERS